VDGNDEDEAGADDVDDSCSNRCYSGRHLGAVMLDLLGSIPRFHSSELTEVSKYEAIPTTV
jgi:hypothetical protein